MLASPTFVVAITPIDEPVVAHDEPADHILSVIRNATIDVALRSQRERKPVISSD